MNKLQVIKELIFSVEFIPSWIFIVFALVGIAISIKEAVKVFKTPSPAKTFPCTGCGACCKRVNVAVKSMGSLNPINPMYFPYDWDENGVCEMLDENNNCKVYHNRPLLCNVDKLGEYLKQDKKEWYNLNITACHQLIDEDHLDESFKVKLFK